MDPLLIELSVLLALVVANGVLAGTEIAVVVVRPTRVRELAAAGSRAARALERLQRAPETFLSTIQVGITLIGAAAGAFGGAHFAADLQPWIARVDALAPWSRELALFVVVAGIAYLSVVLGELVPKSLALRASEPFALVVARPLELLSWIARPFVRVLTDSSNLVLRMFGDRTSFTESRLSVHELVALVDEAGAGGELPRSAADIASRALEFGELEAADVMVHRRFVAAIDAGIAPEQLVRTFLEYGHQRLLLYEDSIDHVHGYVHWLDVLRCLERAEPWRPSELSRACTFVPESVPAHVLLKQMRAERRHLVVAVDEHGGTAGIVTLEDLLEEFVGDITSEVDAPPAELRFDADGTAVVHGTAKIRDVSRELALDLEEPPGQTTMSGLCTHLASGRIPREGETLVLSDGTRLTVVEASQRRVKRLRIEPSRRAGAEATEAES